MLLLVAGVALADPAFSVERGLFDAPFALEIVPSDGGTILYSLDGTEPATPWAGALTVERTAVVRAKEVAADGTASPVATHTYVFPADVAASAYMDANVVAAYGPTIDASLRALPTLSVVSPGLSMTEQAASVEWIDPEGDVSQVDCGARIVGGTSYVYPKASIRLAFRGSYGAGKWRVDLYGDDATGVEPADEHDMLTLRSGNHDTVFYLGAQGQHLRNFWMDESQLDMGHLAPHGRFAHLYLNGAYHGVFHVRERFDAAYMAEYLGGAEDDYEAINAGSAFDGDGSAWAQVVAHGSDYEGIREWMNVENFLDYMVLNFYAANAWDWYTTHNWIAAGPTEAGEGGFRFHSSDSDICLYYDYTTDILSLGGPSNVFATLLAEAHPDFLVALADAIHRNLEADGPLTAENAGDRYARLAALAEDAMVVESARWGYGWWDRDGEWATERDRLLTAFFPYRTDELLRQMRARGWYPLDAPELSDPPGVVAPGRVVTVAVPQTATAELWLATDGEDPRLPGGEPYPRAQGPLAGVVEVTVDRSTVLKARLRAADGTWGPLAEAFYEVDAEPPVVLNEWNAVDPDELLDAEGFDGSGADDALGALAGNGGDWIELLVLQDVDLRGWRLTMEDRAGARGTLLFGDTLPRLRAGTILTVAEDLPEDASYDPDAGDWRLHLRAAPDGTGLYVSAAGFDVTARDWTLTLQDADGRVRFGPAGEGVAPRDGISGREVGLLAEDPSDALRRTADGYRPGTRSTFGAPNAWDGGAQDLSALRGGSGGVVDLDTGASGAGGDPDVSVDAGGCGCGGGAPVGMAAAAVAALAALGRRRGRA